MATQKDDSEAQPASDSGSASSDSIRWRTEYSRYVRPPGGWWWGAFLGVPLSLALVGGGSFAAPMFPPSATMSAAALPTPVPSPIPTQPPTQTPTPTPSSVAPASPNPNTDCTTIESRVARVAGKSQVRFSYGASSLTKKAKIAIGAAASMLRACPQVPVLINGYADRSGSTKANKLISKDRAQAVRKRLRSLGVKNPMTVKGFGDHHPIAKNSTAKGRAANRRVVILIP